MEIRLRYGSGTVNLDVPDENVSGVYRPLRSPGRSASEPLLEAVDSVEAQQFRRAAEGHSVLFLVADATRAEPHAEILRAGFANLTGAKAVTVAITTGSHRAQTPGNASIAEAAKTAARVTGAPEPRVIIHDCRKARFTDHGETTRGNRVLLSSILDDAEVLLVSSDMKHHYFAGYSNPLKDFLPGIAAFETIERNHRLALEPDATFGRHPLHGNPNRRTNPVAEDMLEAYQRSVAGRPCHALITVTVEGQVAHAHMGRLEEAARLGMDVVDKIASFSVPESTRLVVSAGGAPQDDTLYLSQRAVELTRAAIADNAQILLLAECSGGVADGASAYENFYLELTRPLAEVLKRIRQGYKLYQHKAFKFAELLGRVEALHLSSTLPDKEVRAAHLEPAHDPQELVNRWLSEDPSCRITFFDEGNRLCVLPR